MSTGPHGRAIPPVVKNNLGAGMLEKGRWDKLYVWAWDFAEQCTEEECELSTICKYKDTWMSKKNSKSLTTQFRTDKCILQQRYLKTVLHAIIETLKKKKNVSTENMIRMGYQMIPLYAQLFKFKKYEYTNKQMVFTSLKGGVKVNPIYKEIRETIKTIEGIWIKIATGITGKKSAGEIGDNSYIDAMHSVLGEVIMEESEESSEEDIMNGVGLDFDFESVGNTIPRPVKGKKKVSRRKRGIKK